VTVQLDLFGEVEEAERARELAASERVNARAAWQARFERADWIAPYDTATGTPKGARVPGWRCPDPECGEIEPGPTGFVLSINHGFDPDVPGREPYDGRCRKVRRRHAALAQESS
jgi:hypothetical protein